MHFLLLVITALSLVNNIHGHPNNDKLKANSVELVERAHGRVISIQFFS